MKHDDLHHARTQEQSSWRTVVKSQKDGVGYNERLFSGGLRSRLHFARFKWISSQLSGLQCATDSVLELGCFDGKLLDFLPNRQSRYVGFDANWEGGLDMAMRRSTDSYSFFRASSPEEMNRDSKDIFHIAVIMETLEHVPPEMVDGYLRKIAQHLDGYLLLRSQMKKGSYSSQSGSPRGS